MVEAADGGIRIKVLFFAAARELAGTGDTSIVLPPPPASQTTAELRSCIATEFPNTAQVVGDITLAVNQEYLPHGEEIELHDGDEVALIPPISGG